jgi:CRISP-associated protein Cas1
MNDLQLLPKVRDSFSYLYVEHSKIEQDAKAIAVHDQAGKVSVPCSSLTTLMLGPGTSVTHEAIKTLSDNGCLVVWCGEEGVRFYAQGMGETRASRNLLKQAWFSSHPRLRLQVVRRMYERRFPDPLDANLTLQQIRGKEGIRVREAYAKASRAFGVEWKGRSYQRDSWQQADPINRALSAAHSCLYGVCHAAIVSAGYSTALGFIHTGKMLSFVYDIADLYKADVTVPLAFRLTAESEEKLETRVRHACRDAFRSSRLLARVVTDLEEVFAIDTSVIEEQPDFDGDMALPGGLWDPVRGEVAGGTNWSEEGGASDGRDDD